MSDLSAYTDGLRDLADLLDRAGEQSLHFDVGAAASFIVPDSRIAHAAVALGDGRPWSTNHLVPGFNRKVGPHQLMLFVKRDLVEVPEPLADLEPPFASPVSVLRPRGDAA